MSYKSSHLAMTVKKAVYIWHAGEACILATSTVNIHTKLKLELCNRKAPNTERQEALTAKTFVCVW